MQPGKATNLNSNATTVVQSVPCVLKRVTINKKGASSNTLTLYDNASAGSGTVIAVIDTTTSPMTLDFDCICKNGLTAVMGTGTSADITVVTG